MGRAFSEVTAVEMLEQAEQSLQSAAGWMDLAGKQSPCLDYIGETERLAVKVQDMRLQLRAEVGL